MKKYFYIMLGGMSGAILRYAIISGSFANFNNTFPYNTLFVNVTGSLLLAVFLSFAGRNIAISEEAKLGITTGFLGAFTTFSTFCKETVNLISHMNILSASIYLTSTVFLGFGAVYLSFAITEKILAATIRFGPKIPVPERIEVEDD